MRIAIYDPTPSINTYLTMKYFDQMLAYGKDMGRDISKIDSLDGVQNSCVLALHDYFTPDIISRLKNDGNKVIVFHVNDSSYINDISGFIDVDLIFKFSGIQQTRGSDELRISDTFEYTKRFRTFMENDVDWGIYCDLRDTGRLIPMLYTPFYHCEVEHVPYEQKEKKAVIRGGNHYLRYHLFMNLLKHGLINNDSAFTTFPYFKPAMAPDLIYCNECRAAFKQFGKVPYQYYRTHQRWNCNNPYMDWQAAGLGDGFFQNDDTHKWNNRCVPSFYRLTEEFEKYHGSVNWDFVENALNSDFLSDDDFYKKINHNLLYGDYKWMFSVDIPPRFWQGASAKTINILPAWTKNQIQVPSLIDGDHYLSFDETFEGLESIADVTKEQHDHITNNCFELYQLWIKYDKYKTSTHLMDYVFENIERVNV